jgi:TorA maturation chaperone TorD
MSERPGVASGTAPAPLAAEEAARAGFYALLARLYAGAPDADLLAAIAAAAPLVGEGAPAATDGTAQELAAAWAALTATSATADPDTVAQEYDEVFVGVGKSEVNLHASHWLTGFMMERPLAELRDTLARLGLARRPGVPLVEDHLSAVCETMRILTGGQGDRPPAALEEQRSFFDRHVAPWAFACCTAISICPLADYYRRVAQFTECFLALERDSFAME